MAGGEDQPQQFVAELVVERRIRIGHRLLFLLQVVQQHLVLAREQAAAAQIIERAAFGGCHQPRARLFRHAGDGPMFERRHQGFLRQVFGQRHIAQHPGQARDQARLLDAPDRQDGAIDVGGRHRRRLHLPNARIRRARGIRPLRKSFPGRDRPWRVARRCLPSRACARDEAA